MAEPAANAAPHAEQNEADCTLVIERVLKATPAEVFEAWTDPETLVSWWGPEGVTTPEYTMDVRPGGVWRTHMVAPDGGHIVSGVYREIVPPSRLVFTETMDPHPEPGSIVSAVFVEEGKKTRFTATVKYPSQEVRDIVIASGMSRGAGISYDRLEDLVARLQRS